MSEFVTLVMFKPR